MVLCTRIVDYLSLGSRIRSILLVCVVALSTTSKVANSTAFLMALPSIQKEMQADEVRLQWIISAYPLSSGCLLLVSGRIADLYGRKKTFLIGTVILFVFTLGCAFANDVTTLVILRGFQGIGTAAQLPASVGIITDAFPPSRARSLAFAAFGAGAPIGAALGTTIGGLVVQYTKKTWRTACYILAGIFFLCLIAGFVSIDVDQPFQGVDKRVDWLGSFLVTAGLILIVFVLSQGELAPEKWRTPYIIALIILGVLFIIAFFYWQRYLARIQSDESSPHSIFTPPPILNPSIWFRSNGRIGLIMFMTFINWCGFFAWQYWLPLYYQDYKLYTPLEAVVRLLPSLVSSILSSAFVGLMAARVPPVWILSFGTASMTISCLLMAVIKPDVTYWAFCFPATLLNVLGADPFFAVALLFIAKFALPEEQSVAGALFNTMIQLGTATGVTVTTVVFHSVSRNLDAENKDRLLAYQAAQWTAFGFGVIVTIICVVGFRGIGVVGGRAPPPSEAVSATEKSDDNGH